MFVVGSIFSEFSLELDTIERLRARFENFVGQVYE